MKIGILKESMIEYIENIYALGVNYLKNHDNQEFKKDLEALCDLEDKIRDCVKLENLDELKELLNKLLDKIEGVINAQ